MAGDMTGDPMTAAVLQLAAQGEKLAVLDAREEDHHRALTAGLAELTGVITGLGAALKAHEDALAGLDGIGDQVAALAGRLAEIVPGDDGEPRLYRPGPAPRWWKLTGTDREEAIGRVRAWTDQVYRPGYGQLAATLGACWDQHPLCLYGLDLASELWSMLYLTQRRTPAVLSAQAEFQTRILPAIAEQLMIETTRCGHAHRHRPATAVRSPS